MGLRVGILAAGHGDRLKNLSRGLPKALLPVAGKPLIDWTLEALWSLDPEEVVCLINEQSAAVSSYAIRRWSGRPLKFIHKTTASSYESFKRVAQALGESKFLMTTVDGIYNPLDLKQFLRYAQRSPWEMVLGLTSHVDDEKPLRATFDSQKRLTALGKGADGSAYVTAGLYWCSWKAVNHHAAQDRPPTALREFLQELLAEQLPMGVYLLGKVVDVDRPSDVVEAESYLREAGLV